MSATAVVILNYNGRNFLEQFLPGVIEYSQPHEVVVIDNCSTDTSIEYLQTVSVKVVRLNENLGYAGGYKEGLKSLDHDYYVLLNSDVEVTPGWLNPLVDLMDQDHSIAAIQPKILSYYDKNSFEYAGAGGGLIDWLGYPFCRGRIFMETELDTGQYNDCVEIFWASGACMMTRSKALEEAGSLDEDFFAHMEEIDLCWRMKNLGYKVMYNGKSVVYHVGGGTLSKSNPRKTYLNFRNGLYLLIKNKRFYQLIYTLPLRGLLDLLAALKFALSDSVADGWAVLRAHFSVLFNFFRMWKKRRGYKRKARLHGVYWRSIVWARFVRGIKKWDDLNQRV